MESLALDNAERSVALSLCTEGDQLNARCVESLDFGGTATFLVHLTAGTVKGVCFSRM
jgi:hypothetical protein